MRSSSPGYVSTNKIKTSPIGSMLTLVSIINRVNSPKAKRLGPSAKAFVRGLSNSITLVGNLSGVTLPLGNRANCEYNGIASGRRSLVCDRDCMTYNVIHILDSTGIVLASSLKGSLAYARVARGVNTLTAPPRVVESLGISLPLLVT